MNDNTTQSNTIPIITVDGPGGAGKGTLSQLLASRLGFHLLDSGAIYRVLAYLAIEKNIALGDEKTLSELAYRLNKDISVEFKTAMGHQPSQVVIDQKDVTQTVRSEEMGNTASQIAALPQVRQALVACQRNFLKPPGLVADGRDMGSVIFTQAPVKIFLTACVKERANRRYKQLKDKGINVSLGALIEELQIRDQRDQERAHAPLVPADDAVIIDSSGVSIEQVLEQALELVKMAKK